MSLLVGVGVSEGVAGRVESHAPRSAAASSGLAPPVEVPCAGGAVRAPADGRGSSRATWASSWSACSALCRRASAGEAARERVPLKAGDQARARVLVEHAGGQQTRAAQEQGGIAVHAHA